MNIKYNEPKIQFYNAFVKTVKTFGVDNSKLSDTKSRNNAINLGDIASKLVVTKENEN